MGEYRPCWVHQCRRAASHRVTFHVDKASNDYCLDHAADALLNRGFVSVVPCCTLEVEPDA